MQTVVYSYDLNVLRGTTSEGGVRCVPFTSGGRRLRSWELWDVAEKAFGSPVNLVILQEGEGYAIPKEAPKE